MGLEHPIGPLEWPLPSEKDAFCGKEAYQWEVSCSLGRELPSGQVASKVGTKTAVFKKSVDLELVKGFGEDYCNLHRTDGNKCRKVFATNTCATWLHDIWLIQSTVKKLLISAKLCVVLPLLNECICKLITGCMHMTPWQSILIHAGIDIIYQTKKLVLWSTVSEPITPDNLPEPCRCRMCTCSENIICCVRCGGRKNQTIAKML